MNRILQGGRKDSVNRIMKEWKGISVVVPFLNEEDCICKFCNTIDEYAEKLDFSLELIFVDDGSKDCSAEILKQYAFQNIKQVKLIEFWFTCGNKGRIAVCFL